jgi:hypothetical protein
MDSLSSHDKFKSRILYTESLLNRTSSHSQTFNPQTNFKLNLIHGIVLRTLRLESSAAFTSEIQPRFQSNETALCRYQCATAGGKCTHGPQVEIRLTKGTIPHAFYTLTRSQTG